MQLSVIVCFLICIACLISASVSDIRTHKVPDLIWWVMAADALILPISGRSVINDLYIIPDCFAVIFIQEKIMSRYYGRADSHAFSCCGLFFFFSGSGLMAHILHLAVSLLLLSAVQLFRRNVVYPGRLKVPVPFIPYISASFIISRVLIKNNLI